MWRLQVFIDTKGVLTRAAKCSVAIVLDLFSQEKIVGAFNDAIHYDYLVQMKLEFVVYEHYN